MKLTLPKLSNKKWITIICLVLAVIIVLMSVLSSCGESKNSAAAAELQPFTVSRGNISVSITGSGTVEPIEQYEIQSIVTGDIIEDFVSVGTDVKEDDILYTIDSSSAENNIERSESSYEQQLIAHNEKVKNHNKNQANRTVEAPIGGIITELFVENGDSVSTGTKLAEIKNTQNLSVTIPFLSANAKSIYINQSATIYFDDRNEQISGYVSHVASGTYATEAGSVVSDVEITFKNPGAILPGEQVTATVGAFACNDFGTVKDASSKIIVAEVSGEITSLNYSKGDNINAGSLLLKIDDDSSSSDIRSSELSLKNAKLSLDDQIERLEDYTIRSPISGTIISKTMKAGDTLDGNKSSLAIVADMSKLTFEISVDELDIKNILVGQKVKVTADALPDREFEGVVDTISIIGSSVNGVTVYPVDVVISEYDGLLPGMNVNAEIITSEASDVLMIPVEAITRGNYVLVSENSSSKGITEEALPVPEQHKNKDERSSDSSSSENRQTQPFRSEDSSAREQKETSSDAKAFSRIPEAPEGYKYIKVSLGVSNDDYIEVKEGLSEGDEIYYTVIRNTSSSAYPFGMGGMSGGMPRGGMGGMPGGTRGGMGGMSGGMR